MGRVDVDSMLGEISAAQFVEWQAYLDGLGETDDQLNAATMTSFVVNELRYFRFRMERMGGNKDAKLDKRLLAKDLLRRWRAKKQRVVKRQTDAQIMTLLRNHG